MQRKHSDVLLAGLILIGATMTLFIVVHAFRDTGWAARSVVWAIAAFLAAQLTGRVLVDMDVGQVAIAALVAATVVQGIFAERRGDAMEPLMLLTIGAATLGAIAGSLTSRHPRRDVVLVLRVAAAGFGVFGTLLLVGAAGGLVSIDNAVVVIGSQILGGILVAANIEVDGKQCAIGYAVVCTAAGLAAGREAVSTLPLTIVFSAAWAGIGGRFGARIRLRRAHRDRNREAMLPEAQVR